MGRVVGIASVGAASVGSAAEGIATVGNGMPGAAAVVDATAPAGLAAKVAVEHPTMADVVVDVTVRSVPNMPKRKPGETVVKTRVVVEVEHVEATLAALHKPTPINGGTPTARQVIAV
jgi:hypothetical protein